MRVFSLLLWLAASAWGQVELAAFGGVASLSQNIGSRGTFGGSVGIYAGRHVQLFAEYSRIVLPDPYVFNPSLGIVQHGGSQRYDNLVGGVQWNFLADRKVQPYVVAPAIGLGRRSLSGTGYDVGHNVLYAAAGAGVRIFIGKRWGLRPEYRYVGLLDLSSFFSGTPSGHVLTAGVFVQL